MAVTVSTYNHTAAKLLQLGIVPQAANFYLELLTGDATFVASHTTKAAVDNTGAYEVSGNGWDVGGEPLTNNIALVELIWSIKSAAFRFTAQE